ncbi:uncharacterized protein ARMOST_07619 [Armillaria ostoyae]|uniref:Uncharacterized protein n=1 Tax=Armillaria ostoyae TaxID=47428 RepID=A0A284R6A2_ARMOS|nr:uncharacterized protein ARMOST_07619 [Armillaria ostoyae]
MAPSRTPNLKSFTKSSLSVKSPKMPYEKNRDAHRPRIYGTVPVPSGPQTADLRYGYGP